MQGEGAATGVPADSGASIERVTEVGPTDEERTSPPPALERPFAARADEELVGARVRIELAPGEGAPAEPLEVVVNDERVALLAPADVARGATRDVRIERALLAPRNQLVVRTVRGSASCAASETLGRVRSIRLTLYSVPIPLPDDLALLPLPFLDRGYDATATIPIVLGGPPTTPERVRLAALVAGWIALEAPVPIRFEAHAGALPDGHAVVLVGGPADAARLGIRLPDGPGVMVLDHPRRPGSYAKLLVVGGRDEGQLRSAVERLASGSIRLAGPEVRLAGGASPSAAEPYSAPRWLPSGRVTPFSRYPGAGTLDHGGSRPGTLSLRFRVAPDLWIWPASFVVLDLGWSQRIPPGTPEPRLDVELNGHFLGTLPRLGEGTASSRVRLRIPREHVHGFDELRVYVRYPEPDPCASAGASSSELPYVAIAGDSVLHVEDLTHFAPQPDVSLFVDDGWPLTRLPDLSETAVVLPDRPRERELSLVLSILGRLAQVTGRAGTGARFVSGARASDGELAGRDLLVVGAEGDNPVLSRWERALPIEIDRGGARVRRARGIAAAIDLLGGAGPLVDERRAERMLGGSGPVAAVAGIESPLSPGRTVIVVTATTASALPAFADFLGYAESRVRTGDLLVVAGGRRAMFRIGPSFPRGRLDAWTSFRWFLASHWLVLVPAIGASVAVLAGALRGVLASRMRLRLAQQEAAP